MPAKSQGNRGEVKIIKKGCSCNTKLKRYLGVRIGANFPVLGFNIEVVAVHWKFIYTDWYLFIAGKILKVIIHLIFYDQKLKDHNANESLYQFVNPTSYNI